MNVSEIQPPQPRVGITYKKNQGTPNTTLSLFNKKANVLCEKETGPYYDWLPSRGGQDLFFGFKRMSKPEALDYCQSNNGTLVEPRDLEDEKLILDQMIRFGFSNLFIGVSHWKNAKLYKYVDICPIRIRLQDFIATDTSMTAIMNLSFTRKISAWNQQKIKVLL